MYITEINMIGIDFVKLFSVKLNNEPGTNALMKREEGCSESIQNSFFFIARN